MTPNVPGLFIEVDGFPKLTLLNTLNASARNCSRCDSDHGIRKYLNSPISTFEKFGPRSALRLPVPPPKGNWNAFNAFCWFAKYCTCCACVSTEIFFAKFDAGPT